MRSHSLTSFCRWAKSLSSAALMMSALLAWELPTRAQNEVVADDTLGGVERSQVASDGPNAELITGGAIRSQNLFHSFETFNIDEGWRATFDNPAAINNIFARITGGVRSNILGTLATNGSAGLFFINPNGVLLGPQSSLDVGGSLVISTANSIGFGNAGNYSATNPAAVSSLLSVAPSVLLFNEAESAAITNQSQSLSTDPNNNISTAGLRVPDGEDLLLVGGDINMKAASSGLAAFGGRIDIGGLRTVGAVRLVEDKGYQ
ncbi:haemagglutination activity domain protein [Synechococcus sp. PCC 7335]|uniref:filamentous hemagglutinin N-terminal domain-containing protein n=1 Tax=Synechococcus sp. (strain ATCC 29403 / PCC 7335) TaxID=91464 RepID=UPI00017ECF3C|nr:filamentous hemagglutinin N-terminal domain-containing protein [Synechococcus sp. PCC 7335]EDX82702.1 haemagglutination activity domain protein [Synechococcus sp. PCC 7335]